MRYQAIKRFSVKICGETMTLHPGETIQFSKDKADRLLRAGVISLADLEVIEDEYFQLLARWWDIDNDPKGTKDETQRLVTKLDELYRELHLQGVKVPVRLPVEKGNAA